MKRFLSLLLVFALVLSCTPMMPIQAQAATEEQSSFDGYTAISTKEELDAIRNNLNGKYYLTADIVFADEDFAEDGTFYNNGAKWIPIGTSSAPFTGIFDGNGHLKHKSPTIKIKQINIHNLTALGIIGNPFASGILNCQTINAHFYIIIGARTKIKIKSFHFIFLLFFFFIIYNFIN
jgi:hypothetical protein